MSAHDDYLDPDIHLWQDEDYGYDEVLSALKARSTGRWQYDQIDCCLSGKDADLDTGNMGLRLDNVDDEYATATVRGYKTEVGDDVALNLSRRATRAAQEAARDAYLEATHFYICDCGYAAEWDGDDWGITFSEQIKVPIVLNESEDDTDAEKTAEALIAAAEKALEPFEKAMADLNNLGNMLAGWRDEFGKPAKAGKPSNQAAWRVSQ